MSVLTQLDKRVARSNGKRERKNRGRKTPKESEVERRAICEPVLICI